jgi:hypothetical protein
MNYRFLQPEDVPKLHAIAWDNGFPYPPFDDPHIVGTLVVTDDSDNIIVAGCAKQILEAYGWCAEGYHPVVVQQALKVLFEGMKKELTQRGWREINAFVPVDIATAFGRRLLKFGWGKNLVSYFLRW